MWAAIQGHARIVALLLDAGTLADARDSLGTTPLILATQHNASVVWLLLVERGVDIRAADSNGCTVAHWAAYGGNVRVLRAINVRAKELLSSPDLSGLTPLHRAARGGRFDAIAFLLNEAGLHPCPGKGGVDPLPWATKLVGADEDWEAGTPLALAQAAAEVALRSGDFALSFRAGRAVTYLRAATLIRASGASGAAARSLAAVRLTLASHHVISRAILPLLFYACLFITLWAWWSRLGPAAGGLGSALLGSSLIAASAIYTALRSADTGAVLDAHGSLGADRWHKVSGLKLLHVALGQAYRNAVVTREGLAAPLRARDADCVSSVLTLLSAVMPTENVANAVNGMPRTLPRTPTRATRGNIYNNDDTGDADTLLNAVDITTPGGGRAVARAAITAAARGTATASRAVASALSAAASRAAPVATLIATAVAGTYASLERRLQIGQGGGVAGLSSAGHDGGEGGPSSGSDVASTASADYGDETPGLRLVREILEAVDTATATAEMAALTAGGGGGSDRGSGAAPQLGAAVTGGNACAAFAAVGSPAASVLERVCFSCHLIRPLRAKHCAITDRCYERFDHHCPWVGTTICEGNHVRFLLFVALQAINGVCLAYLGSADAARGNGGGFGGAAWGLIVAAPVSRGSLVLLWLLHALLLPMLVAAQLRQMSFNLTTNERMGIAKYSHFRSIRWVNGALAPIFDNPFERGSPAANLFDMLVSGGSRAVTVADVAARDARAIEAAAKEMHRALCATGSLTLTTPQSHESCSMHQQQQRPRRGSGASATSIGSRGGVPSLDAVRARVAAVQNTFVTNGAYAALAGKHIEGSVIAHAPAGAHSHSHSAGAGAHFSH